MKSLRRYIHDAAQRCIPVVRTCKSSAVNIGLMIGRPPYRTIVFVVVVFSCWYCMPSSTVPGALVLPETLQNSLAAKAIDEKENNDIGRLTFIDLDDYDFDDDKEKDVANKKSRRSFGGEDNSLENKRKLEKRSDRSSVNSHQRGKLKGIDDNNEKSGTSRETKDDRIPNRRQRRKERRQRRQAGLEDATKEEKERMEATDDSVGENTDLTERGKRKFELLGRVDMLQLDRDCRKKLPQAIIIGVMKAGTEAFSTFLAINPQVAMSLNVRSTLFFVAKYYARGLDWYRQQMTCSTKDQITIEKAPQYFPSSYAPGRIYKMDKNVKLILMVRNPIDRAVSHYLQVKNSHPHRINDRSFEDVVFTPDGQIVNTSGFIALSRYSVILKRWLEYFKLSQILIVDGDEFKTNQIKVLSEAETFLGIKHYITDDKFEYDPAKGFYCLKVEGSPACFGAGKGREHPPISAANYHKLKAYFKPYNEEFYKIVGRRFDW